MAKQPLKIELFVGTDRDFHWHMKRVGRVVGDSGEGYERKRALEHTLDQIITQIRAGNFKIVDRTHEGPLKTPRIKRSKARKRPPVAPEAETMD